MRHDFKTAWLVLSSIAFVIISFGLLPGALAASIVGLCALGGKLL